jgi:nitrite reductase/ring-hydroxylating ferredoxin subunit
MSCERCVNRREFLARAAGTTGVAAVLAACGDGVISGVAMKSPLLPPEPVEVKVGDYPGLATVGVLVQPNEAFVALKRLDATTFDCFLLSCTHEGCLLDITNGQRFDCPCHGSRFANDGSVVLGPARRPLQKIQTTYDPATDLLTIG